MRCDVPNPWRDREGHFHHLVEGRLVAACAQRTIIFCAVECLQRAAGVEHAAAARTQHVPGEVENTKPGRMQERRNGELFIDVGSLGEVDDVDPAEGVVGTVTHECFDRRHRVGVRRLPQYGEESLSFAHDLNVGQNAAIDSPT